MGCVCSCKWITMLCCCKSLEKKILGCCCKEVHCCTCPHKCCKECVICHCRKKNEIPYEINYATIDKVCSSKEYNSWIKGTEVQRARKWFYDLTFYVDLYCWIMILGNLLGVFAAHLIPILAWLDPETFKPWGSCLYFETDDLPVNKYGKYAIGCILEFHFFNIPVMVGVMGLCIYTLIKWNYRDIALFLRIIQLTNILEFGYMIYEALICWIVFVRNDPWYQSWTILALGLLITIGVILGVWIQFAVQRFFDKAETYELQHPKTEYEIISLVRETYIDRGKIRCVASKHSAPNSIYVDNLFAHNEIMVSLDLYTGIKIIKIDSDNNISEVRDDEKIEINNENIKYRAIVKGGTCLGLNRENPLSNKSNGLVYILDKKGFALQDTGGVVMQQAGGFTAMGCAGGTLYHDYYESIHSIRIINGKGEVVEFIKPEFENDKNYNDPYWGVIVSMGLMGIISEITYDLIPTYNVLGSQIVWPIEKKLPKYKTSWLDPECVTDEQKKGNGDGTGTLDIYAKNDVPNSLYNLMKDPNNRYKSEYFRIFAWPQTNPNLVTVWKGHREQKGDEPPETIEWKNCYKNGKFKPVYYHEVDKGKKGVFEQKILSLLYNYFDHYANNNTQEYPQWMTDVVKRLIKLVNSVPGTQYFGASWADILP
eukprot:211453_1